MIRRESASFLVIDCKPRASGDDPIKAAVGNLKFM